MDLIQRGLVMMPVALAIGFLFLLALNRKIVSRTETAYPAQGNYLFFDGCRYHYQMAGSGRAVVLLHGSGGSLEDYDSSIFANLAKDFRVVAIDRPGHGHSERPPGDVGTPAAQAGIVHEILRALEIEPALIVGHSWSGALALAYALEFPAETLGVVLLEGTVYRTTALRGRMLRMLSAPVIGWLLANLIIPWAGRGSISRMLERAFHPEPVPPPYLQRAKSMWTRPGQARAIAVDARRRDETIDALSARYHELSRPIVVVAGGADSFIDPSSQSLRLGQELAAMRVFTIAAAGHQIPQTQPRAVIEAVRFLAEHASEVATNEVGIA